MCTHIHLIAFILLSKCHWEDLCSIQWSRVPRSPSTFLIPRDNHSRWQRFLHRGHGKYRMMRRKARAFLRSQAQVVLLGPGHTGAVRGSQSLWGESAVWIVAGHGVGWQGGYSRCCCFLCCPHTWFLYEWRILAERNTTEKKRSFINTLSFLSSHLQFSLWLLSWPFGCEHSPRSEMLRY